MAFSLGDYVMFVTVSAFAFLCVPVLTFITPSKQANDAHAKWLKLLVRNYWLSLVGLALCLWQLLMWVYPYPSGIWYWYSLTAGFVVGVVVGVALTREYVLCKRNPEPAESETETA